MDILPLINAVIGITLIIFIFLNKHNLGQNFYAKTAIIGVITIFTFSAISEYIMAEHSPNRYNIFIFITIILSHLTGYFLLLFISVITNYFQHIKKITFITLGISILRLIFYVFIQELLIKTDISGIKNFTNPNFRLYTILANIDEFIMVVYNLTLIIIAYKILKKAPLIISLKSNQTLYYKWGNIILIFSVSLYTFAFINTILLSFSRENLYSIISIENLLQSIFFIFLTISMMYFPVFAYSGRYEDLPSLYETNTEKYKNSTLNNSYALFMEIDTLVKKEKLYLDSELKMNKISKKLSKSIPYISQAINENTQKSFPDYINSFRVEEAKKKLLIDKPDTIFAIAIDVGFNNKTTFYNAFKKQTNMTPSQYKKEKTNI
ncbi:AraC-type DNA-binding protein [Tenacibaculum sp. 190524A02b]|uniref:AraC-type DNA-binding protein n=1 Tax=Tenacibaculum vairaonense TaxID=3137860 RepID=A0ABP1FCI9_9FLAO